MTVIEQRTMEIICSNLPQIAKQLKRIADTLEVKKENYDANARISIVTSD